MRKSPTTFQLSSILKATCKAQAANCCICLCQRRQTALNHLCYCLLCFGKNPGKNEKAESRTIHRQISQSLY